MLERLVASTSPRGTWRATPSAVFSTVVHGLVIVGAVVVTRAATPASTTGPDTTITILFPSTPGRSPSGPSLPVIGAAPNVDGRTLSIVAPVVVPIGIPAPDEGPAFEGWRSGPAAPVGDVGSACVAACDPNGVVLEAMAEEAPLLLAHPPLEYPSLLRAAGIEGTVVVEIVVDTAGVPEPATFRVISATNAGFTPAAKKLILGTRFRPGRWHGRPARVLIRQPVWFRLAKAESGFRG